MDDELLIEFLNESHEHLATIEADLLAIEAGGEDIDEELVNKVFRAAHSIKGGSSFFGLGNVKELAHRAETVLDRLRSRQTAPSSELVHLLLASFDRLREMIEHPRESAAVEIADLVAKLGVAADPQSASEDSVPGPAPESELSRHPSGSPEPFPVAAADLDRARNNGQCIYALEYDLVQDFAKPGRDLVGLLQELADSGEVLTCRVDFKAAAAWEGGIRKRLPMQVVLGTSLGPDLIQELALVEEDKIRVLLDPSRGGGPQPVPEVELGSPLKSGSDEKVPNGVKPAEQREPMRSPLRTSLAKRLDSAATRGTAPQRLAPAGGESLRVSVGLLECLMNLAGELVLSRNQLHVAVAKRDPESLILADQRLHQVTSELQDAIMRTRLQPIGNVLSRFPRVVRDMAGALGKEIRLEIAGKEVSLDRNLVEGLSDPLTHMVRNAVDHGIEPPEVRTRAGKTCAGLLRIEARHEAGQVVVEIADDGKGIDPDKVAEAALAKGLLSPERLSGMSNQEKIALIFAPGLSTAERVTELSGRGVGMDVVKTNLERLGGKVEIDSEIGRGTVFRIKLPLTLAIIPSLIVSVGSRRFAIPQSNIDELLRIRRGDPAKEIGMVGNAEVLLLRDEVLPLVRLDRLLTGSSSAPPQPGSRPAGLDLAVVTTGTARFAVAVGAFHETQEIVVKPLGKWLKALSEYAGATVLGDGTLALVLDVAGVAAKAALVFGPETGARRRTEAPCDGLGFEDSHSLLLFHNGPNEVFAAPLGAVLRVERTTPDRVEMAAGRRTMAYRGGSLPLVTLSDVAPVAPLGGTREWAVIVTRVHDREIGLLGALPVDVVESRNPVDGATHRQRGIAGSIVIRDRTTLIANLLELVEASYPDWKQKENEMTETLATHEN